MIYIRRHVSVAAATIMRVTYKNTNNTQVTVQNELLKPPNVLKHFL